MMTKSSGRRADAIAAKLGHVDLARLAVESMRQDAEREMEGVNPGPDTALRAAALDLSDQDPDGHAKFLRLVADAISVRQRASVPAVGVAGAMEAISTIDSAKTGWMEAAMLGGVATNLARAFAAVLGDLGAEFSGVLCADAGTPFLSLAENLTKIADAMHERRIAATSRVEKLSVGEGRLLDETQQIAAGVLDEVKSVAAALGGDIEILPKMCRAVLEEAASRREPHTISAADIKP